MLRVEAEVLEAMVRHRVAGAEALVGARAGDVDRDAAVLALTADEAIAEHPRLVADDLELERLLVPLGGLARIRCFQVDVVDPERHGSCLPLGPAGRVRSRFRTTCSVPDSTRGVGGVSTPPVYLWTRTGN